MQRVSTMTTNHVNTEVQRDLKRIFVTDTLQSIAAVRCDVFQTAALSSNVITGAPHVFGWNWRQDMQTRRTVGNKCKHCHSTCQGPRKDKPKEVATGKSDLYTLYLMAVERTRSTARQ